MVCALFLSGCSVDLFSKSKPDPAVTGLEHYRTIRPECSGLKIQHPDLDPPTFRSLVTCFAANGSIPEISELVNEASDRTILQTVDLLNATFLADPKIRADSRAIVRSLKKSGRWEPALAGFSPAFTDPARMRALIHLLSLGDRAPLVVKTVQSFDAKETLAGFELLSRLAKAPAFASLSRKILENPLTVAERDRLLGLLANFFARSTAYHSANLLIADMAAGKSAAVWSFAFGDGAGIRDSTSHFRGLLRDFTGEDGLRNLSRIHRGFHHPIACWGDGKVFAEPWRNLTHELSVHAAAGDRELLDFVGRFAPVTAIEIPEICAVPDEFLDDYPSIMRLTAGRSGGEYLGVLKNVFNGGFGLSAGYFVGEWGEPLAEALTVVEAKPWFSDLVLLIGELDAGDRELIAGWMNALLRNRDAWTALTASWEKGDLSPVFADLGEVLGTKPSELVGMLDSIRELFESSRVHPWFQGWKRIAAESNSNGVRLLADLPGFPGAAAAIGKMASDGRLAVILGDVLELLSGSGPLEQGTAGIVPEPAIRKSLRHGFVGEDLSALDLLAPLDDSLRACARLDLRKSPASQSEIYQACLSGGGVDAKAYAGIHASESWMIPEGATSRSFIDSILESVLKLPVSTGDRREIIAMLTGKRPGIPAVTSEGIQEFFTGARERFGASRGAISPSEIFTVLNRWQTGVRTGVETWQSFFKSIELAVEDVRFAPLMNSVRSLVDPATVSKNDTKVGPAPAPPVAATVAWVRDLECESDGRAATARATEIGREFESGVLGWERPGGKLPLAWKAEDLKPRVRALSETLTPALRANLYAWLGRLDPKTAAQWFAGRASDPRLVAVMDPETKQLRVRWMTTLDRLESILVNSDFTYILRENYGLKFIGEFAEAWGDEPRARWPREIQAKYSGSRTPPKLADVYADVLTFVGWFEKFGGISPLENCVAKDGPVVQQAFADLRANAPAFVIPLTIGARAEIRVKAFNLKQTLSVVRENLPGAPGANAGGMRLLRDLFWAIYSSAPAAQRSASAVDENPLRFLQRLGDVGGLRSISRGLQPLTFASERIALEDAFGGLRRAVAEPAFDRLLGKVLATPRGFDDWIERGVSAPAFDFGRLVLLAVNSFAADRTLGVLPAMVRFADSFIGGEASVFPNALVTDLIVTAGSGWESTTDESFRLQTRRAPDGRARDRLAGLGDFVESRIFAALARFPLRETVTLLDRDSVLRTQALVEAKRWLGENVRQAPGAPLRVSRIDPLFNLLLSEEHPELRRAIGLWCGRSAGLFAFELASHPDKSVLMIDGLLQSGQSGAFSDFLDSLLRELGD